MYSCFKMMIRYGAVACCPGCLLKGSDSVAVDKRGRKLPKGIRQRSNSFEGRFTYRYKEYVVHGDTITETQKKMTELKYRLEHGMFVEKEKTTLTEWHKTWMEEYKKNRVKVGTYVN